MQRGAVIIEAAINGITQKATNPHVPRTSAEIAADSLATIAAGASIIHNHISGSGDPATVAEEYLACWRPVLAERPDALLYPTANAIDGQLDLRHLELLGETDMLRLTLCDPGSVNLGGVGADGVPVGGFVYSNSYDSIAVQLEQASAQRLGPSLAMYEPGFLRTTLAWWKAGRLPAGTMFKFYLSTERGYLGAPFGLPPTKLALDAYLEILGDCPVPWAISVVGGDVVESGMARYAIERGGHIQLGLEFFAGERTPTNVELVNEAIAVCDEMGVAVASCNKAAEILELPRR